MESNSVFKNRNVKENDPATDRLLLNSKNYGGRLQLGAVARTWDRIIAILSLIAGIVLSAAGADTSAKVKAHGRSGSTSSVVLSHPAAAQIVPSNEAQRVGEWIASASDNHALPYAIIDKNTATLTLYGAAGNPLAEVPVLIGIAPGDDATPGVGSKKLGEIGPAEKTTPAGRFLAKFGYAAGRQQVLWVDYTNSVAIHPIPADAASREQRRERMLSPGGDDNRITFGCINVPRAFYVKYLRPLFRKRGGYVYVLPDTKQVEEVFPRLRAHDFARPSASL